MSDNVNHPKHYQGSNGIESIQVIEGFNLNYNCGTAAAYIMRADRKGGVEDLKKAVWHLNREIAQREGTVPVIIYGPTIRLDGKEPTIAQGCRRK